METKYVRSDRELVMMAQAGDGNAFMALYSKYKRKIENLVKRLAWSTGMTEDIMQEVAFQAFLAIRDFRGNSEFYTWIYRIATNISLQYVKKNKRFRLNVELDEKVLNTSAISRSGPEREIEKQSFMSAVMREIDKLPPQQRSVLVMAALQGMSYEDMSIMLGVNEEVIKGRLHRARESIRSQLAHLRK